MSTDLIPSPARELSPAQQTLSIIANAAADPACDVGKMQALIDMQRGLVADEAKRQVNLAMVACQADMQPVVKNCLNRETNQKFANLEAVDAAIKPIYQRYGFGVTVHNPQIVDGQLVVCATVIHKAGHSEPYSVIFANDSKGPKGGAVKTEIQGAVSTISYATRVLKCKIFDITITGSDQDGQRSAAHITEEQALDLESYITEIAGDKAPTLRSAVLRLCQTQDFKTISKQLLPAALEYCKMVAERRKS